MIVIHYLTQIFSEFFPISSTLLLKSLNFMDDGMFHIFNGVLFIIIFHKKLLSLIKNPNKNFRTILNYFFISLPSAIVGIILTFYSFESSYTFQIITNIVMGIILYISVKYFENHYRDSLLIKEINTTDSIFLGLFLSLNGIFPGMSRLGTSLIFLLFKGYGLKKSYELSLITSIPIIIGKPLVSLIKNYENSIYFYDFISNNYILIILSFIGGLFLFNIIKYYLSTKILKLFAFMRILFFVFILILHVI